MPFNILDKNGIQPPSLRRTLFKYVSGPVITVFLVLFAIVLVSAALIIQNISDRQASQISYITNQIDLYLNDINQLMMVMSNSIHHVEKDEIDILLNHIREYNPQFTAIYIINPKGIVTYESSDSPILLGLDLSGEPFFPTFEKGQTFYSDPFVSLLAEDVVVTAATSIYDHDEFLGLLVAEMNLSKLQEVINQINIERGYTSIIDSKGTYIAHPDDAIVQERQYFPEVELLEQARKSPINFELIRDREENQWLITSLAQVSQGWFVITQQPISEVLFPLSVLIVISLVAFFIAVILFFGRVQRSLEKIATPIAVLADNAEQIAQGNYDVEFKHSPPPYQEINSLERSFAQMIDAIQSRDRYLEQRVEQRTRQLEQANKDLEAFMYSISHDLRAPLRAIVGYSDILTGEYAQNLDEEGRMYLERITAQGDRMDNLITDLLDLSRLGRQSLRMEKLDLSILAQEVFDREIEKYKDGEHTELVLHPTPIIEADPNLLEILLTNLIDNAIKFSRPSDESKIEFGFDNNGTDSGYFFLKDNGIGFDEDFSDKLFLPFHRLHPDDEFEGSGIGLAIVMRVIQIHEGEIWVESAKGKGTTFYFSL